MDEGARRIRKFYIFRAVTSFSLWGPFWTIWVNKNLEDLFLMTVVDTAFWITMIVFQIPAGLIGDKYGRKAVLFVGEGLFAVGVLTFGLSTDFYQYFISNMIWALGACFIISGDTPFVYDTLVELKREKEFTKIMGNANAVMFVVNAFAFIVGGAIGKLTDKIEMTLIFASFVSIAGSFAILSLTEPKVARTKFESYQVQFKEGFRHVLRSRPILLLILFQILIQVSIYVMAVMRGVYMNDDLDLGYLEIGLLYASFSLVGAFTVKHAGQIEGRLGEKRVLAFMYAAVLLSLGVVYFVGTWYAIIVQFFIFAVADLQGPILGGYINRRVDSAHRSTVAGISSAMFTSILVPVEVTAGYVASEWSLRGSLLVVALMSIPPAILLLSMWFKVVTAERKAAAQERTRTLKRF